MWKEKCAWQWMPNVAYHPSLLARRSMFRHCTTEWIERSSLYYWLYGRFWISTSRHLCTNGTKTDSVRTLLLERFSRQVILRYYFTYFTLPHNSSCEFTVQVTNLVSFNILFSYFILILTRYQYGALSTYYSVIRNKFWIVESLCNMGGDHWFEHIQQ